MGNIRFFLASTRSFFILDKKFIVATSHPPKLAKIIELTKLSF